VTSDGAESAEPSDPAELRRRKRRLEIAATVLLSPATVLTAWSAFWSTKWSGVQAIRFSQASASRTVLSALVLFFGAVSTRLESPTLQAALLSIGAVVFVVATAITISFPVEF
jgi:hypothetical protein